MLIDYLELLLERWADDEEEREALDLKGEGAGFSRKRTPSGDADASVPDGWETSAANRVDALAMGSGRTRALKGAATPVVGGRKVRALGGGRPLAAYSRKSAGLTLMGALRNAAGSSLADSLSSAAGSSREGVLSSAVGSSPTDALSSVVDSSREGALSSAVGLSLAGALSSAVHSPLAGALRNAVGLSRAGALSSAVDSSLAGAMSSAVHSPLADSSRNAADSSWTGSLRNAAGLSLTDALKNVMGSSLTGALWNAVGSPLADALKDAAGLPLANALRKAAGLSLADALRKEDSGNDWRRKQRSLDGSAESSKTMDAPPLDGLLSLVLPARAVQAGQSSLHWSESSDGRQAPAAGAAALERRLTEQSLAASMAAPVRTLFAPEADPTAAETDWYEFDRRLERDARRYDGSMSIY